MPRGSTIWLFNKGWTESYLNVVRALVCCKPSKISETRVRTTRITLHRRLGICPIIVMVWRKSFFSTVRSSYKYTFIYKLFETTLSLHLLFLDSIGFAIIEVRLLSSLRSSNVLLDTFAIMKRNISRSDFIYFVEYVHSMEP